MESILDAAAIQRFLIKSSQLSALHPTLSPNEIDLERKNLSDETARQIDPRYYDEYVTGGMLAVEAEMTEEVEEQAQQKAKITAAKREEEFKQAKIRYSNEIYEFRNNEEHKEVLRTVINGTTEITATNAPRVAAFVARLEELDKAAAQLNQTGSEIAQAKAAEGTQATATTGTGATQTTASVGPAVTQHERAKLGHKCNKSRELFMNLSTLDPNDKERLATQADVWKLLNETYKKTHNGEELTPERIHSMSKLDMGKLFRAAGNEAGVNLENSHECRCQIHKIHDAIERSKQENEQATPQKPHDDEDHKENTQKSGQDLTEVKKGKNSGAWDTIKKNLTALYEANKLDSSVSPKNIQAQPTNSIEKADSGPSMMA